MVDDAEVLVRTGRRSSRRIVCPAAAIASRVRDIGREISDFYAPDDPLLVIGLLKGSFIFMGDLVREIVRPLQVDFIVAGSYGSGTKSSGEVKLLYDPAVEL